MLSRISDRANLTDSEGINGFALAGWPYMGFQSGTVRNIDAHGEQVLDAVNNADILKHIHPNVRRNLNHDIDVAVGAGVAARARTEQGSMTYPERLQSGFVLAQLGKDVLFFHK